MKEIKGTSTTVRMLGTVLVRGMKSFTFAGAVLAVALLHILNVLPVYMEQVYTIDGVRYVQGDILQLFVFGEYTLFPLVALCVAVLPFGFLYCEDKNNNMMQMILQRCPAVKYSFVNMLASGIGSFITVFCGQILFVLAYAMTGLPLHSRSIDSYVGENMGEGGYSLVGDKKYLQLLLAFILLRSLCGAFFGILSTLLSAYVKNKLVITSMPVILYYFLMRFGYGQLQLPVYLNIRGIYWMFVFAGQGGQKEWQSIAYTFVMTLGLYILFSFWLEHKIRRAE